MSRFLLLGALVFLSSCQPESEPYSSDEYVLIEFAAKLEEDYEKLYPEDRTVADGPAKENP